MWIWVTLDPRLDLILLVLEEKWANCFPPKNINLFQPCVLFHIETSHLLCKLFSNQTLKIYKFSIKLYFLLIRPLKIRKLFRNVRFQYWHSSGAEDKWTNFCDLFCRTKWIGEVTVCPKSHQSTINLIAPSFQKRGVSEIGQVYHQLISFFTNFITLG